MRSGRRNTKFGILPPQQVLMQEMDELKNRVHQLERMRRLEAEAERDRIVAALTAPRVLQPPFGPTASTVPFGVTGFAPTGPTLPSGTTGPFGVGFTSTAPTLNSGMTGFTVVGATAPGGATGLAATRSPGPSPTSEQAPGPELTKKSDSDQ
jgi:hypothetical protein